MPDGRRRFGDDGERIAAEALGAQGVRIVARNVRTRYGELDLIGRDARGWVFVEVKTRRTGSFVAAAEAVDGRKLARVRGLALAWMANRRTSGRIRLIVAAVAVGPTGTSVEIIDVAD